MASITEMDCVEALRSKLGHKDFTLEKFFVQHQTDRLGFLSEQVVLTVVVRNENRLESHDFFVKLYDLRNARLRDEFLLRHNFNTNEFKVVRNIIPDLEDVASKKITAKFLCGNSDSFIIFEHLSEFGFELNRREEVDENHARVGVETLAHFHSLSFAKERELKVLLSDKYEDIFCETIFAIPEEDPGTCYLHGADVRLRCFLRECVEDFNDVDVYASRLIRKVVDVSKPSTKFKNVICHGDSWSNNFLYKYDESGCPLDAILVDFQMTRYAPPAHDLVYFMRMNVPEELRRTHEVALLTRYYEALEMYLFKRGINVDDVFPRKELMESYAYFSEEYGPLVDVYFTIPAIPREHWPDFFGDDELMFETLAKGNVSTTLKVLRDSPDFKRNVETRVQNLMKYHKP